MRCTDGGALSAVAADCCCVSQIRKVKAESLWTYSMGAADFGVLLLSAWLDGFLQPRHCPIKDWRYSPVVNVCDFIQRLILQRGMRVMRG